MNIAIVRPVALAALALVLGLSSPAAAAASMYDIQGYAAHYVTGGGVLAETSPAYRKVTTAAEFVAALRAARSSGANPVKVIEIANDLAMGWNEVEEAARADGLERGVRPAGYDRSRWRFPYHAAVRNAGAAEDAEDVTRNTRQ